jgi:hypothetical protein
MKTIIPEKITQFQAMVEEINTITAEQVSSAAILPSKEEIHADAVERKREAKRLLRAQKAAARKGASASEPASSSDPPQDDAESDDDEDYHTPHIFVPSKLHIPQNPFIERINSIAKIIKDEMNRILFDLRTWLRLRIPSLLGFSLLCLFSFLHRPHCYRSRWR